MLAIRNRSDAMPDQAGTLLFWIEAAFVCLYAHS
jgi:hypothetical protein